MLQRDVRFFKRTSQAQPRAVERRFCRRDAYSEHAGKGFELGSLEISSDEQKSRRFCLPREPAVDNGADLTGVGVGLLRTVWQAFLKLRKRNGNITAAALPP